jgi:hypothetical protein
MQENRAASVSARAACRSRDILRALTLAALTSCWLHNFSFATGAGTIGIEVFELQKPIPIPTIAGNKDFCRGDRSIFPRAYACGSAQNIPENVQYDTAPSRRVRLF